MGLVNISGLQSIRKRDYSVMAIGRIPEESAPGVMNLTTTQTASNKTFNATTMNDPTISSATAFGIGTNDITTALLMGVL